MRYERGIYTDEVIGGSPPTLKTNKFIITIVDLEPFNMQQIYNKKINKLEVNSSGVMKVVFGKKQFFNMSIANWHRDNPNCLVTNIYRCEKDKNFVIEWNDSHGKTNYTITFDSKQEFCKLTNIFNFWGIRFKKDCKKDYY